MQNLNLIAATLMLALAPGAAWAQAPEPPLLDVSRCDPDSADRLRWLVDRLEAREFYADAWWRGWLGVYSIGMVYQSIDAGLTHDGSERADSTVSAIKALGGVARLLFFRPTARLGADPLLAEPLGDAAVCRARVAQGEELLREASDESQQRWSWKAHAINVGVNLAGALIVTQGFDEKDGWHSMGIGIAVGEAQIWSHPWQGKSDLEEYQARFSPRAVTPSWAVIPTGSGLAVQVRF
jgi:hypothetical protein